MIYYGSAVRVSIALSKRTFYQKSEKNPFCMCAYCSRTWFPALKRIVLVYLSSFYWLTYAVASFSKFLYTILPSQCHQIAYLSQNWVLEKIQITHFWGAISEHSKIIVSNYYVTISFSIVFQDLPSLIINASIGRSMMLKKRLFSFMR